MPSSEVRLLIVSRPDDEHGDVVERAARVLTSSVARLSLNTLRETSIVWAPGIPLCLGIGTDEVAVGPRTTVWWRRPGWVDVSDLDSAEAELVDAEVRTMFDGMLITSRPRWIDDPIDVELAENKLYQLAVVQRAGVTLPQTLITNSPDEAFAFANSRDVIAKTVSTGEGLAPFAADAPRTLLERVAAAPTLLQEKVPACADLRVVTVGEKAFTWSSMRDVGNVDWRRTDPEGGGFRFVADHPAEKLAIRVARLLNLTHSSQDWLDTNQGPIFLEANPGGQWLFLTGATEIVVPALTAHLLKERSW